jgi:3',5'-cyclic AMP phosphodiesterase CpdA
LRANNRPDEFQFAITTDRTGGPRPGVFEHSVKVLNLLQPELVISVGDLISGTSNPEALQKQWDDFNGFVRQLEMPFFYLPGNHDIGNKTSDAWWGEKLGRRYYHFLYREVLFLMLNTEETPRASTGLIGAEQLAYIEKVLAENQKVRWTIVALHKPLWTYADVAKTNWIAVEKLLHGRPHTVFAGHKHRYERFERNGAVYYMLATTGGSSKLRGIPFGEFDHIVWVTMKKDGPRLANVMLDGVHPENIDTNAQSDSGAKSLRK